MADVYGQDVQVHRRGKLILDYFRNILPGEKLRTKKGVPPPAVIPGEAQQNRGNY